MSHVAHISISDMSHVNAFTRHVKHTTGWPRPIGYLICIGHFPKKSPIIGGSSAENDLQSKASYGSWPPCTACCTTHHPVQHAAPHIARITRETRYSTLHHAATRRVHPCDAVCCSCTRCTTLMRACVVVAVCCSCYVAVYCSVLQLHTLHHIATLWR